MSLTTSRSRYAEPTKSWSWIGICLGIPLLALSFRGVDWKDLSKALQQTRLHSIYLAFFELTLAYLVRAIRWRVVLSAEKSIACTQVFWANMAGYLGNSVLPARAGEVIRSVLLGLRTGTSKTYVLATALTEKLMDTITLVLISSVALLVLPNAPKWLIPASSIMASVAAVGLVGVATAPHFEGVLVRLFTKVPITDKLLLSHWIIQFILGVRALHHFGRAFRFFCLTLLIWGLEGLSMITIAYSMNLPVGFPLALLLLTALALSSALPSTPGYIGIYQFVAVTVLGGFGIFRDQALAFILMFQAVCYSIFIVFGCTGIWRLKRDITHLQEVTIEAERSSILTLS